MSMAETAITGNDFIVDLTTEEDDVEVDDFEDAVRNVNYYLGRPDEDGKKEEQRKEMIGGGGGGGGGDNDDGVESVVSVVSVYSRVEYKADDQEIKPACHGGHVDGEEGCGEEKEKEEEGNDDSSLRQDRSRRECSTGHPGDVNTNNGGGKQDKGRDARGSGDAEEECKPMAKKLPCTEEVVEVVEVEDGDYNSMGSGCSDDWNDGDPNGEGQVEAEDGNDSSVKNGSSINPSNNDINGDGDEEMRQHTQRFHGEEEEYKPMAKKSRYNAEKGEGNNDDSQGNYPSKKNETSPEEVTKTTTTTTTTPEIIEIELDSTDEEDDDDYESNDDGSEHASNHSETHHETKPQHHPLHVVEIIETDSDDDILFVGVENKSKSSTVFQRQRELDRERDAEMVRMTYANIECQDKEGAFRNKKRRYDKEDAVKHPFIRQAVQSFSSTTHATMDRSRYNYVHNMQDAFYEQERLLRESATRVRQSSDFFAEPVTDLTKLPSRHWKFKNLYARLGLPNNANFTLVKKHYRKLCLLYHPDKATCANAPDRFQGIKEAYETISERQESII